MGATRNILFIMCDQWRADYWSGGGHPTLKTPNMDALAARGVSFSRAYVQSPVCGPSRMSFYTGRYMFSHGSHYNGVPLRIDELTLGDHLRVLGCRVGLVGKTHFAVDGVGKRRLAISQQGANQVWLDQCGFEPWEWDDGLHPDEIVDPELAYNRYLNQLGYDGDNPWHTHANSALGADGEVLSGWHMRNARLPARVRPEHSETAYMTDRAMDMIDRLGGESWCMHLSYIKPHWPYMAPAPYHALYTPADVVPANRDEAERADPHPVTAAFMDHDESRIFTRDDARYTVIPTYMGLIAEIDHHLGRLMAHLEKRGRLDDTMIVLTSDHGDYLGDHWLGEKELFHEESVRIPLVVVDPDRAADGTRGRVDDRLVEGIDLVPSFVEALGGTPATEWLEGRSLLPLLREDSGVDWRDAVISEGDYAWRKARLTLDLPVDQARAIMIRDDRWKYIFHYRFRPQLFDLREDPRELNDLGEDPAYASVCQAMREKVLQWMKDRRLSTTMAHGTIAQRTNTHLKRGFKFGVW